MANRSTGIVSLTLNEYTNYKCPLCKSCDELRQVPGHFGPGSGYTHKFKCETERPYYGYAPHYWVDIHTNGPDKINLKKEVFAYFSLNAMSASFSATLYLSNNNSMCILNNWDKNQQIFLKYIPSWDFTNEDEMVDLFNKRWRNMMLLQ